MFFSKKAPKQKGGTLDTPWILHWSLLSLTLTAVPGGRSKRALESSTDWHVSLVDQFDVACSDVTQRHRPTTHRQPITASVTIHRPRNASTHDSKSKLNMQVDMLLKNARSCQQKANLRHKKRR